MLIDILDPVQKRLDKLFKSHVKTDSSAFRFHCVFTFSVLAGSSVLVTTSQLIGNPIECVGNGLETRDDWLKAIQTWCWINSTFLMPDEIESEIAKTQQLSNQRRGESPSLEYLLTHGGKSQMGRNIPYPGVMNEYNTREPKTYYTYYQWVCFVLFFQGLMCYIPKAIWKHCEGGLLSKLTAGVQGICQKNEVEKHSDNILCYLQRYRQKHFSYMLLYWICEGLCLVNLLVQMWFMNVFLGGKFFSIGIDALKYTNMPQHERNDPLIYIFPRITKCTFYKYGPSGTIINLDNMCVLPQNIINEKIYIFLWFWYIALCVLFVCVLLYRVFLVVFPRFRARLLVARSRFVAVADAKDASSMLDIGDWWLLYMLAKNIDPLAYRDLLAEFVKREKKISLFK